jgi:hypothetical protein
VNCTFLLSDMHHEDEVGSMTILNPFKVDQAVFLSR